MAISFREIPSDRKKRRQWILFNLRARGTSLADVARGLGIKPHTAYPALVRRYPRVQREIARLLEAPVSRVFPEFYGCTGGHPNAA